MINLAHEMDSKRLKSRILLQVHDELVLEVPDDEMETINELVPRVMSSAIQLNVPLKVDSKRGSNWGSME
jgi:DNA polymerase-1